MPDHLERLALLKTHAKVAGDALPAIVDIAEGLARDVNHLAAAALVALDELDRLVGSDWEARRTLAAAVNRVEQLPVAFRRYLPT